MDPTDYVFYQCNLQTFHPFQRYPVRWLDWEDDFPLAQAYWASRDCPLAYLIWMEARDLGYRYAAAIENGSICSCAAAWKYSTEKSELSAVSTAAAFRLRGYAKSVCSFVTADILQGGQIATMTTSADNLPMQQAAERLGYTRVSASEGMANRRLMNRC